MQYLLLIWNRLWHVWCLTGMMICFLSISAHALPRMSLTAGTPCRGCHFNPNGGGGRTELGWSSMNHTAAVTYDKIGLKSLHNQKSNGIADGLITLSYDVRIQGVRLKPPVIDEDTKEVVYGDLVWIPMQIQPYLAIQPTHNLTLYGSFMPGPNTGKGDPVTQVFPGMNAWEAWGMYNFGGTAPSIRVGMFQPTLGIRHDDHTIMLRGNAKARRAPILPPNYNELGAEVIYQPKRWLRTEVGFFTPTHLRESINGGGEWVNLSRVVNATRITFLPQFKFGGPSTSSSSKGKDDFDDDFGDDFGDDFDTPSTPPVVPTVMNTWFGASSYWSNEFLMLNGFMGIGLSKGLSVFSEFMWRTNSNAAYDKLEHFNSLIGVSYELKEWLVLSSRMERAQAVQIDDTWDEVAVTWQFVAGMEFFPLPYVEIRPEYRLVDLAEYRFGQATVQVHLFY